MRSLFFVPFFFLALAAAGQHFYPGHYLEASGALSFSTLRDEGVSPLNYYGTLAIAQFAYREESEKWDWKLNFAVGGGQYDRAIFETYVSESLTFFHGALLRYRLWQSPDTHWDLRAGLSYQGMTNIRSTPAFLNNSSVWESMNDLLVSTKFSYRWGKKQDSQRFLFFKVRNPTTRYQTLDLETAIGVLTTDWRPGYAYLVDFTDGDQGTGDGNELNTGGLRLRASLSYTYYLLNGNGLRLGYTWDGRRTQEGDNQLLISHQLVQLGILFRFNP